MSFDVVLVRSAEREYKALPPEVATRVARALRGLSQEPRPRGSRKLTQGPGWRRRVGDYRILYTIDEDERLITVYAIRHRRGVYRH